MAAYANYADAGGLMSYGALASESVRRAAEQTARILNSLPAAQRVLVTRQIDGRHLRVVLSDRMVAVAESIQVPTNCCVGTS